jgi:hypothetical protein
MDMTASTFPVEYVYVPDHSNPFMKDEERPRGQFLGFPMRTGGDKIFYGTGMAYLLGIQ